MGVLESLTLPLVRLIGDTERIHAAILMLSNGSIDCLMAEARGTERDWRDT
jgi:hypothetical protein